ncbi:hypothetical protein ACIB24_06550 [Spongisporangium articulatum]|uniref:Uncharacterized protein n=1 Tax=Spongisporangium articulatum TaxID=3362603 RepID=A0ABW8AK37_9ACTN
MRMVHERITRPIIRRSSKGELTFEVLALAALACLGVGAALRPGPVVSIGAVAVLALAVAGAVMVATARSARSWNLDQHEDVVQADSLFTNQRSA